MYFSDEINKKNELDIKQISDFLSEFDVEYDYPDKTFVIREDGNILASGSADNNILKYFFTKAGYSGLGLINIIYKSLLDYMISNNHLEYFVFTSTNNKTIFKSLGLNEVISTDMVSLFEGGFSNYNKWINKIKEEINDKKGVRGSIIMNTNPMTLGHKYLIEKALESVDELLIFVVEEDKSVFPFNDRFSIMKNELKDYSKIKLIKSGPYIISQATFPTYFIKEKNKMLDIYTNLDAKIFANKIAKDLAIDIRFLGSEPKDLITNTQV